jgi:hypothetical protein
MFEFLIGITLISLIYLSQPVKRECPVPIRVRKDHHPKI